MTMVRAICRDEDDKAVEDRSDSLHAPSHVIIPQLKVPTPGFMPSGVEVEQDVEPPIQVQAGVHAEVCMNSEAAPALDLMKSAALKEGIGHEPSGTRQHLQKLDEGRRIQLTD
jgi:hypothetical protein